MPLGRPRFPALAILGLLACGCARAPGEEEARAAIVAANPSLDTATVIQRVWEDGPPWFSCAEILAKLGTPVDHAVVQDQLGNWRALVQSGWIVLRDTAQGVVSDPGWCTAKLTPAGLSSSATWRVDSGPAFPTGARRRGWTTAIGRHRVLVTNRTGISRDSAMVDFDVVIAPNASGAAMRADRDTLRYSTTMVRRDGRWIAARIAPR